MAPNTSLFVIMVLLLLSHKSEAQSGNTDDDGSSDPWKTPLQELESIATDCVSKSSKFLDIAIRAQNMWQSCIDTFTPKIAVLEGRNSMQEDSKINESVIYEIDKQLHMAICRNTSAYKHCWSEVIQALNECEPGSGDVSGELYFALYDDICREGGRITVENRRKAAAEGKLCERDYSTEECKVQRQNMKANDLCLRFQSNAACDLSSIDPNCQNKVDKGLHADIFERVEKVLGCSTVIISNSSTVPPMSESHSSTASSLFHVATSFSIQFWAVITWTVFGYSCS